MPRRVPILLLLLLLLAPPAPAADTGDATRQELERIKKEMAEKKKKLKSAGKKERSTLSELERIDREILAGGAELAEQQRKLREAEAALVGTEQGRTTVSTELERLRPLFAARLRALYKMQRSGGYALAVLSSEDASSASRRARALAVIASRDRRLLVEYEEALGRLAATRDELQARRAEMRVQGAAVEARRRELGERRAKKRALLASVQREKGAYEETLAELEDASVNLWALVHQAGQERKTAQERNAATPAAPARLPASGKELPWPVQGKVLTRFGNQRHPQFGTMVFRRGIEIQAREGEEVRAVSAGQVAFADWYKGYGRLVIVDHGNGFYTLYGHLSVLGVEAGGRVEPGQVVGRAGDTGSLAGPRLYFELRRNGAAQDPLLWLAKR